MQKETFGEFFATFIFFGMQLYMIIGGLLNAIE